MSPARTISSGSKPFPDVGLQVVGVAVEYPELHQIQDEGLRNYAAQFYPMTPALEKVLDIAGKTGINTRACAFDKGHPIMYGNTSPTIEKQGKLFMSVGVQLATAAARRAIAEWGGDVSQITHVIGVSSSVFSNPGFEYLVARELGLSDQVERNVLNGVGCAGGLAGLRTAANIACGASFLGKPARILIVSAELGTITVRNELDMIHERQEVRIPAALFADAGSALVLSNGIGEDPKPSTPVYDVLAWSMTTVPDSAEDITFDVHPDGWRATLTHRVPKLTSTAVPGIFSDISSRVPSIQAVLPNATATDFDWAVHPGGAKVLVDVAKVMGLEEEHLRASWNVYRNHGNTSSATIFSVLNKLRTAEMGEGRDFIVACAFGPGISVETSILRRCRA